MAEQDVASVSQDLTVETEARKMGWKPQEEFDGDPARWVSAEEFVERGQQILPILTQNNRRLKDELSVRDQRIEALNSSLQEAKEAIDALKEHQTEATKRAVAQAKQEVLKQLKEARETGDVDAEFQLSEQLADLRSTERSVATATVAEKKETPVQPAQPTPSPELLAWKEENPWFEQDQERTARFMRIAAALRASGVAVTGRAFVDEVSKAEQEFNAINGAGTKRSTKVDSGSRTPATASSTSSKSFNSLPADAKESCMSFARTLVGPNKAYKTLAEWQTQYAKDYYGEA